MTLTKHNTKTGRSAVIARETFIDTNFWFDCTYVEFHNASMQSGLIDGQGLK